MTAGNSGASTPEDDDPFGYLYADGQASGATPPGGGGGYGYPGPRSSYHQVRPVGERQYGNQTQGGGYGYPPAQGRQATQGGYGYPPPAAQQPTAAYGQAAPPGAAGYHQPSPHYRAPETVPGAPVPPSPQPAGPGGRGRGPNHRGLLIGAIAVVAAVVIGIGIAVLAGGDDGDDTAKDGGGATPADSVTPTQTESVPPGDSDTQDLPKADAQGLKLAGGAAPASDVKGAKASGGTYVGGLNKPGASVTWTVDGIAKSGKYTLQIGYGVPGKDADATLSINGKPQTTPLNLKNWANAKEGDWEKGWTRSYAYIELNKGTNNIKISCEQGNHCDANLDQLWLEEGWKE
ncbi:carbohydrate-binding protein [Streptomyces sp. NPDC050560]|uniref:carbohydrate-binding protein n=1 Tax=Streptomyces sp. NPDC050560 TaxID=3365630 RepID=UPI00378EF128